VLSTFTTKTITIPKGKLSKGYTYSIKITAFNNIGDELESEIQYFTFLDAQPLNFRKIKTGEKITLNKNCFKNGDSIIVDWSNLVITSG
jgi:hypothetical protein